LNVRLKKWIAYPSSSIFLVAKASLMMRWPWHKQTPLSTRVVHGLPHGCEPLVHDAFPAHRIITAPPRRHLHVIKWITYEKWNISNTLDLLLKEHSIVVYDALDLRLVVHVLYKLDASVVRRNRCAFLVSLVTPVEILHITMIYPVIFRNMSNECDVLRSVLREILTHSSALTRSALLSKHLFSRSSWSGVGA